MLERSVLVAERKEGASIALFGDPHGIAQTGGGLPLGGLIDVVTVRSTTMPIGQEAVGQVSPGILRDRDLQAQDW